MSYQFASNILLVKKKLLKFSQNLRACETDTTAYFCIAVTILARKIWWKIDVLSHTVYGFKHENCKVWRKTDCSSLTLLNMPRRNSPLRLFCPEEREVFSNLCVIFEIDLNEDQRLVSSTMMIWRYKLIGRQSDIFRFELKFQIVADRDYQRRSRKSDLFITSLPLRFQFRALCTKAPAKNSVTCNKRSLDKIKMEDCNSHFTQLNHVTAIVKPTYL